MGVLVDYFAASAEELESIDLSVGPAGVGWAHVDCKGWVDELSGLVAELAERDRHEFGDDAPFWAGSDTDGPWLTRVGAEVTLALAGVSDDRLAKYAEDEGLEEYEADRNVQLRDLARSAVTNGQSVYCWTSL